MNKELMELLERFVEAHESIARSMEDVGRGMTFRSDSEVPSIPEALANLGENLNNIASSIEQSNI